MPAPAHAIPLHTGKRLIVSLLRDDLLDAINTPLRVRRGQLLVDYTQPVPVVFARCNTAPAEPIMAVSTRPMAAVHLRVQDEGLRLMLLDMHTRLAAHRAGIAVNVFRNRRQQRMCRLEIAIADASEYPVPLYTTPYRTRSPWLGPVSTETSARIGAAT